MAAAMAKEMERYVVKEDLATQADKIGKEKAVLGRQAVSVGDARLDLTEFVAGFLRDMVGIEAGTDAGNDPASGFADWLNQDGGRLATEVFAGEQSARGYDRALAERGVSLMVKLETMARQKEASGACLVMLRQTLLPTLARLAEEGASPEEQIDALVAVLKVRAGRLTHHAVPLARAAAGLLATQRERETGYYKTYGALADLLQQQGDRTSRAAAAALYGDVLDELRGRWRQSWRPDWLGLLRADANNRASTLHELGQAKDALASMQLAVAAQLAGFAAEEDGRELRTPLRRESGEIAKLLFGRAAAALPDNWPLALARMANIPTAWESIPMPEQGAAIVRATFDFPCLLAAYAAPARLLLNYPRKDVTGSLFNAGVNLVRAAGSGDVRNDLARVGFNAAGLRLALTTEDLNEALVRDNGLDCAVNLLGALSALKQRVADAIQAPLQAWANQLWSVPLLPQMHAADYQRMENSLDELKVKPESGVETTPVRMLDALAQLVKAFHAGLGVTHQIDDIWAQFFREPNIANLSRWTSACLQLAWNEAPSFPKLQTLLADEIARLAARGAKPHDIFEDGSIVLPDAPDIWAKATSEAQAAAEAALRDAIDIYARAAARLEGR